MDSVANSRMDTYILMMIVTGDQENAIKSLFQFKGWKFDKTGSVNLPREEFLQKNDMESGDYTSNSVCQSLTHSSLQHQSQFANSFRSVIIASENDMSYEIGCSSLSSAVPYNSKFDNDKTTKAPSLQNTQVYPYSKESDIPVSTTISHIINPDNFGKSKGINKQSSQSNEATSCLSMETTHETTDSDTHQNSILLYPSVAADFRGDIDNVSTKADINDGGLELLQMEPDHQVNKVHVICNENIDAKLADVAVENHLLSMHNTVSDECVKGPIVSVHNPELMLDSKMNTSSLSDTNALKLADHFHAEQFSANNTIFEKCNKWLLNEFDKISKFLQKVFELELHVDRKLVLLKLNEILAITESLQKEKFLKESGSKHMIESTKMEEIKDADKNNEIRDHIVHVVDNWDEEKSICREENDYEPVRFNSGIAPVTCIDIETEADKEVSYVNEPKQSREKTGIKTNTYNGSNRSISTKWIKSEILNCHKGINKLCENRSRHFSKNEGDSTEVEGDSTEVEGDSTEVESRKQKCITDRRMVVSANERKKMPDKRKKSSSKNDSVKFRWTVNRNMRMHKCHRKCKTVPPDLDADSYSELEKGFFCPDCQFIFKGKNKLILHKRLKSGFCLPDCIYCDADQQKDVYQCSKCPKCFLTKEMLGRHKEKHAQFLRCNFCKLEFYTINDLKFHTQGEHAESVQPAFLCDLCGSKFMERKVLNAHQRFVHSDERPEVCTSCGKSFKTKSQLKSHLVSHKKVSELNLSCEVCGKMFLRVATLKDHVRRHKKEFSCYCTICNKGFYRKYGLEEHMRVHTGDKPFDCKFCGFKCALSCNLVKHMKTHQKYSTSQTDK